MLSSFYDVMLPILVHRFLLSRNLIIIVTQCVLVFKSAKVLIGKILRLYSDISFTGNSFFSLCMILNLDFIHDLCLFQFFSAGKNLAALSFK